MLYSILIVVGLLGMGFILWLNHPRLSEDPTDNEPWYVLHPENFESGIVQYLRSMTRKLIKWILIQMIMVYRKLSEKIALRELVKKKIRGYLYEHNQETVRKPSEFWNNVRRQPKKKSVIHHAESLENDSQS